MTESQITDTDLADLVQRVADSNTALIRGEAARYISTIAPDPELTLMTPFGGHTLRYDASPERVAELERFFRGGTIETERVASWAAGDLAVLVLLERARATIGELPEQDWALRVTLVFRRDDAGWRLVHRHADPLAHRISVEAAAALARGQLAGDRPSA